MNAKIYEIIDQLFEHWDNGGSVSPSALIVQDLREVLEYCNSHEGRTAELHTLNEEIKRAAANLEKLPFECYTYLQADGCLIRLKRGEIGYWRSSLTTANADQMNAGLSPMGITDAQVMAMESGSLFGWHTKAADPDTYTDEHVANWRAERNVRGRAA